MLRRFNGNTVKPIEQKKIPLHTEGTEKNWNERQTFAIPKISLNKILKPHGLLRSDDDVIDVNSYNLSRNNLFAAIYSEKVEKKEEKKRFI